MYIPSIRQIPYFFSDVDDVGWIVSRLFNELYQLQRVISIKLRDVVIAFCELEMIREEPVLAYFKVCLGIRLEGLRKTMKTLRIVGGPAKVRIGLLPSASLKRYCLSQPLCC
jgi:hypothetical protein